MQAKHFSEIENAELAATHSIMQLASQTYSKYSIQNPAASMSYLLDKLCDLFELPLIMTMMVVGRKGEGSRLMLFKLSDQLPRKLCLVKSRGFAHLAKLGLVVITLHCVTVKTVRQMTQDRLLWRDKVCPAST